MSSIEFIATLEQVITERLAEAPQDSYTAALARQGIGKVAQKLGEEAVELALAAVSESDERVAEESADLLYHLLVLLAVRGSSLGTVVDLLERRHRPTS